MSRIRRRVSAESVAGGRPRRGLFAFAFGFTAVVLVTFQVWRKSREKENTDRLINYDLGMGKPTIDEFEADAIRWLEANAPRRKGDDEDGAATWGEGAFSVAVFHSLDFEAEHE